jgi:tetratricopeptide (TPR) repeat protein
MGIADRPGLCHATGMLWAALLLVTMGGAGVGVAPPGPGAPLGSELRTARTHRVEVASMPGGLESEMPRTGAYARGIRADAELDFAAARAAYALAIDEFRRLGQPLWSEKASRQLSYSMTLERAAMMLGQMAPAGMMAQASWRLPFAVCYHEKFLSTRAFLGHPVAELAARAESLYRQILDDDPDNASARLDLAALYAELGQVGAADAEFRRVPEGRRSEDLHALEVARYHAARGQSDEAFRALERARRRLLHELREVNLTNGFDRLRRDPRFTQLVGSLTARPPLGQGLSTPWPGLLRPTPAPLPPPRP